MKNILTFLVAILFLEFVVMFVQWNMSLLDLETQQKSTDLFVIFLMFIFVSTFFFIKQFAGDNDEWGQGYHNYEIEERYKSLELPGFLERCEKTEKYSNLSLKDFIKNIPDQVKYRLCLSILNFPQQKYLTEVKRIREILNKYSFKDHVVLMVCAQGLIRELKVEKSSSGCTLLNQVQELDQEGKKYLTYHFFSLLD